MDVRNTRTALLSLPALAASLVVAAVGVVATATPGYAATDALVAFRGTVVVTPQATPQPTTLAFCFADPDCGTAVASTGTAAGAATDAAAGGTRLAMVDGLRGTATYIEGCTAGTGLAPTGTAIITANAHEQLPSSWKGDLDATWFRVGLVAVIQGAATGAALFVPQPAAGVPACAAPVRVDVTGAVQLTY